jgi:hypothetical protein
VASARARTAYGVYVVALDFATPAREARGDDALAARGAGLARGRVRRSWTQVRFYHSAEFFCLALFHHMRIVKTRKGKLGRRGAAWKTSRRDHRPTALAGSAAVGDSEISNCDWPFTDKF